MWPFERRRTKPMGSAEWWKAPGEEAARTMPPIINKEVDERIADMDTAPLRFKLREMEQDGTLKDGVLRMKPPPQYFPGTISDPGPVPEVPRGVHVAGLDALIRLGRNIDKPDTDTVKVRIPPRFNDMEDPLRCIKELNKEFADTFKSAPPVREVNLGQPPPPPLHSLSTVHAELANIIVVLTDLKGDTADVTAALEEIRQAFTIFADFREVITRAWGREIDFRAAERQVRARRRKGKGGSRPRVRVKVRPRRRVSRTRRSRNPRTRRP